MDDEQIVEGEVVSSKPTDVNSGEIIVNMESMIKSHISEIDKLNTELKKHKEMLDDIFLNDPTYQEHDKKAKEAARIKNATKNELLKRTDVADLNSKVREMKITVKEFQSALNEYVREYQRLSGVNEITDEQGNVLEIVYTVKLVRKSSKKT